jgi:hypothetical protein
VREQQLPPAGASLEPTALMDHSREPATARLAQAVGVESAIVLGW